MVSLFLRSYNGIFENSLGSFEQERRGVCGENLGSTLPEHYPGQFWCDEKYPVRDIETNVEHIQLVTTQIV